MEVHNMSKFIVFEGLDNLGKTTQINLLKEALPKEKYLFTSCPNALIRNILTETPSLDQKTEVLLFAASHANVTHHIIQPTLEHGVNVICDRYYHSGLAYQCGLKGNPEEDLLYLHERFSANLQPDIIFYFYGEPYPDKSVDNPGGYDGMSKECRKKVEDMYDKHLALFQGTVIFIPTDGKSEQEVHTEIMKHLGGLT
jgi:dTMP kinase